MESDEELLRLARAARTGGATERRALRIARERLGLAVPLAELRRFDQDVRGRLARVNAWTRRPYGEGRFDDRMWDQTVACAITMALEDPAKRPAIGDCRVERHHNAAPLARGLVIVVPLQASTVSVERRIHTISRAVVVVGISYTLAHADTYREMFSNAWPSLRAAFVDSGQPGHSAPKEVAAPHGGFVRFPFGRYVDAWGRRHLRSQRHSATTFWGHQDAALDWARGVQKGEPLDEE